MRAWITPDSVPEENTCWHVYVPDSVEFEAAFRGALLSLQEVHNWQKVGDAEPEDCAEAWFYANAQTFVMGECAEEPTLQAFIGSIITWPSATPPTWGLICDGSTKNVSEYPDLYAVVGNTWGGTPDTTFVLPDLRGRFSLGVSSSFALASTGGAVSHQLTVNELPSHYHPIPTVTPTGSSVKGLTWINNNGVSDNYSTGSDAPHNNMPPYMALYPVIVALAE